MQTISTYLTDAQDYTLQDVSIGEQASRSISTRKKGPAKHKIERVYADVPIVFNTVNKYTQVAMAREREINGPNSDVIENFLDSIGNIGGAEHWDEVLNRIFRYQFIYGEHFLELVTNEDNSEIVDIAEIDPKTIDYARESPSYQGDTIALDRFGNPVGYVQRIETATERIEQVYEVPDNVHVGPNEVYIPADRIVHFKLFTVGEGFYPIGIVEPVFNEAENAYQLQEDLANKMHTLFPMRIAKVGDERHEPNPEKVDQMLSYLQQAANDTEGALPYHVDVNMLEAEHSDQLLEFFNRFDTQVVTGAGVPKAFATGEGTDVNRATLRAQDRVFQLSLRDVINRTAKTIETGIFEQVLQMRGEDRAPNYEWNTDVELPEKPQA